MEIEIKLRQIEIRFLGRNKNLKYQLLMETIL